MLLRHRKSLECYCSLPGSEFLCACCTHQVLSIVRRARWVSALAAVKEVIRVGDPGQDRRASWASCLVFRSFCISAELQSSQSP